MKIPKLKKQGTIFLIGCLLIFLILGLVTTNHKTCSQILQQTNTDLIQKGTRSEAAKKFIDSEKQPIPKSCRVAGNSSGKPQDSVTKFKYYHQQAMIAYNLGDYGYAKKNAEEGLKIDKLLSNAEKAKIKNYNVLVQDLNDAKVDPYAK